MDSTDDIGYYPNTANPNSLIYCTGGSVSCSIIEPTAIGYYKKADSTVYTKCLSSNNCVAYTPSTENCSTDIIGQIDKNNKLCLHGALSGTFESKSYLVNFDINSSFRSSVNIYGFNGVVDATATSIILNNDKTDICVDISNYEVVASSCEEETVTNVSKTASSGLLYFVDDNEGKFIIFHLIYNKIIYFLSFNYYIFTLVFNNYILYKKFIS